MRDLGERTSRAVSGPRRGFAHEPSISADGQRVVFAELPAGGGQSPSGRPAQRLLVRDLASGDRARASSDGAPLPSWSGQPQLSGDGRRIAYTTDAGVAAGGGPGGLRVLVGSVPAATTMVASPPAPLGSFDTARALQPGPARICSLAPPAW